MNNTLSEKLKQQAANQLYKNRIHNLTQKELILRTYSKSSQFVEIAIQKHKIKDLQEFRTNTNNAILLIQTLHSNLNYVDQNGNTLDVAFNLHKAYTYMLKILGNGLSNNNTKDFKECINFLNELYFAFDSI